MNKKDEPKPPTWEEAIGMLKSLRKEVKHRAMLETAINALATIPRPLFALRIKAGELLQANLPLKPLPSALVQARISFYVKNPEGHPLPMEMKVLDTTKGDIITEIIMWEQEEGQENPFKAAKERSAS